jgi:signal transduction histidine kinase
MVFLVVTMRRTQWLAERQMEFVAGVSHELRTPIAGISSLSQNLADGVVRDLEQAAQYGATINNESRRLNEMVEKVLQFAAIRSGQYRYDPQPVDLGTIIEKEVETFKRMSVGEVAPGASPIVSIDGELPPVLGDEQALRSVVRNLVSNAIKFQQGGAPISVLARRADDGSRNEVELCVTDHGPGIAAADIPHIFDPFYRGEAARAGQVRGSGLGLSLVREIVQAHRGRVQVTTAPGGGSTFQVYLPIAGALETHGQPG